MDRLQEFSSLFGQYMKLYKEFVELVYASQQSFLVDFLEPCGEDAYPGEILYEPHIRRATKQLNECEKRLGYLSNVLVKDFPKGAIFKRVRKIIRQRAVPEETGFIVTPVERMHIQECDGLLAQMNQLVCSNSVNTPRKDPRTEETKEVPRSETKLDRLHEFSSLFGQYAELYKKYLDLVYASEQSYLDDILKPCREDAYPGDNLYEPHIRRATKQLIEYEKRVGYLSDVLVKDFPKGAIFKRVRKIIIQRAVPEETDFLVTPVERMHIQECDELLSLIKQFVSSNSSPPEDNKPRKVPRSKGSINSINKRALPQYANPKPRRENRRRPLSSSRFVYKFRQ